MRNQLLMTILGAAALVAIGCEDTPRATRPQTQRETRGTSLAQSAGAGGETVGELEVAALFRGPMPTGVAVSKQNRLFVNFPRWGDPVEFTVAEVKAALRRLPHARERPASRDEVTRFAPSPSGRGLG